ncbi:MAG TPA: cache domain-containing protein, partial [Chitinophagaceae bacterium]
IRGLIDTVAYDTYKPFGWYHYHWQVPGEVVPRWKSTYVQLVTTSGGEKYIVGCGIYNMKMEKAFIEELVNRAASLISEKGKDAFPAFRDKTGPFIFLDTYVFVETKEGVELVNPAQPSLEGKNIFDLKDLRGREMVREEIAAAMEKGSAWLECYWYRPIDNKPGLKQTYVRKVVFGNEVYIIGSGVYGVDVPVYRPNLSFRKVNWINVKHEELTDKISRQMISGEKATISKFSTKKEATVMRHHHDSEEFFYLNSGVVKFIFENEEVMVKAGELLIIPSNLPHAITALEDAEFIDFFAPVREDWMKGEDLYLRKEQKAEVAEPMFDPLMA